MTKWELTEAIRRIVRQTPGNTVTAAQALRPELEGLTLLEEPLIRFGSAQDPLFDNYKDPKIIGPWHMSPREWMPEAETVVSLFFPFPEEIRRSMYQESVTTSDEWLHGRVEGQAYLVEVLKAIRSWLEAQGIACCIPLLDPRYRTLTAGKGIDGYPGITEKSFGSVWSERHAAYVCGLGTFGLSKGIITEKGMSGRLGSVIISLRVEPDERPYTGVYDYCIRCGACARRCPVEAITLEQGKDQTICSARMSKTRITYAPRLGCGQCQTAVPCERQIPRGARTTT